MKFTIFAALLVLLSSACSQQTSTPDKAGANSEKAKTACAKADAGCEEAETTPEQSAADQIITVSAAEFNSLLGQLSQSENVKVLDIRTPGEFAQGHLPGADNSLDFYQSDFSANLDVLDKSATYFVYCRSGNRSGQALRMFQQKGFHKVYNLAGGINVWAKNGYEIVQ